MFTKNSRYFGLETVEKEDRSGRAVKAVKLRRPPQTPGLAATIRDQDQLDVMSELQYGDPTRYWHIGDANSDLETRDLVATTGRSIEVPEK